MMAKFLKKSDSALNSFLNQQPKMLRLQQVDMTANDFIIHIVSNDANLIFDNFAGTGQVH